MATTNTSILGTSFLKVLLRQTVAGSSSKGAVPSNTSLLGMIDQSSVTSDMGTGIYFLASIGIISASSFGGTSGISITDMRLDENGIATPARFVVTLTSFSINRSWRASIIFSCGNDVATPTDTPA